MRRANENPLTPASLATGGIQGAGAKASGHCKRKPSPQEATALVLSLAAVDAARWQLDRLAAMTDAPPPGAVEAADDLDIARDRLAQAVTP